MVVSGTNGSTAVATATIDLDQTPPSVSITANPGLTVATGTSVTLTASGASTYRWSNGASTTAITVTTANTYSVTGTAPNGCTATAQVTVTFVAPPSVNMAFPQFNSSYIAGTTMTIRANATTPAGTTITKVEFYSSVSFGAFSKIGEAISPPYSLTYTLPAVPGTSQSRQFRAVVTNSASVSAGQGGAGYNSVSVYAPTYTSTRNWYVNAVASSGNTAGTEALPFNTIQKAADRVAPGDTVFVMAGSYASTSQVVVGIQRTGLPNQPIVFMPYRSDKPVVALGNNNFDGFRILPAAAYVRIQGFEVVGNNANITLEQAQQQPGACEGPNPTATPIARFNGNGMSVNGGQGENLRPHHIVIANNTVHDCAGQGIGGSECDYVTIENNVVYNNSWYTVYGTSGINIINAWNFDNSTTAPRIIIRKNRSYGNKLLIAWNIGGTGTNCRFFDGNGIILDNNRGTNPSNPAQIKNPLGDYTGKILIENNLCYLNGGRGINVNYSDNTLVINNTTYQNGQSDGPFGIGIDNEFIMQGSIGARIFNNIFYGKSGELPTSVSSSQDVQHNNNLTFGGSSNGYFTGNQNLVGQDPLFVDAASGDFQLQASSPAINMGSNIAGQFAEQDILGITRPQGAGVDMGAYEFQGTALAIIQQPASSSAVCLGADVTVSVSVSGTVEGYQWYKDGQVLTGVASATTATLTLPNVTLADAGSYSVVITGFNSLTSTAFSLTVGNPPTATLSASPSTTLTCSQSSLTLTAGGGDAYSFSGPGLISQSGNTAVVNVAGVYSVTVNSAASGCASTTSITISQDNALPMVNITANPSLTITQGQTTTLTAQVAGGTSPLGFSWSTGQSTSAISTTMAGPYSVTVTNTNGCSATASAVVSTTTTPIDNAPFAITAVSTISCTPIAANRFSVQFTPQYGGLDGSPVSFSVANELASTTNPGPYSLSLYTDNPVITLRAVQGGVSSSFAYNWLSACTSSTGNTAPTVANPIPPQSATVGVGYTLSLASVFTDAETPNGLTLRVSGLPAGLSFVAPATISGTPSVSGVSSLTVIATDPGSLSTATSVTITVSPAGSTPPPSGLFSISSVSTIGCTPIAANRFSVQFTPQYGGLDGSPVSFSVANELASTTNPGPYGLSLYTDNPVITLRAVQSGISSSFVYNWLSACTSSTGNTAPTVANPIPPQSATVGVGYTLSLASVFTDAETPNGLTLRVSGLPAGMSFVAPATISGTPSVSGVSSLTVIATDPGSLSTATSVTITVSPAGSTPPPSGPFSISSVSTIGCTPIAANRFSVQFTPQYGGLDGSPVSFSVANELASTTNPGPYSLSLYTDNPVITLRAVQGGVSSSFAYNWLNACGSASARRGAEPVTALHVTVLGNPQQGATVSIEVSGAEGQPLQLQLMNGNGREISSQSVGRAGLVERQQLNIANEPAGLYFLRVSTPTQQMTVKLVRMQ